MRGRVAHSGATLVEYIVALAILVVVFIVAAGLLQRSSIGRADSSVQAVESAVPCGAALAAGSPECL